MTLIRRLVHTVAWIGTVAVVLVALTFIASQTPWFRDWIRRAIVREAKQYLNGELTIGRLGGNLFFGVTLSDVAVDVSGDRVVAIKTLEVDYSVLQLISEGIVVDRIALTEPSVHVIRDEQGWNIGRLVKAQRQEADREGPRRPVSLPSITIVDGSAAIDDRAGSSAYRIPRRIEDLDVDAGFEYAPVHFSIELRKLNLRGIDPEIALQQLSGKIAVRDDNLYLDRMVIRTGETALDIDGVIAQYLRTPVLKLTSSGNASLPELGRVLPAVSGYGLHPALAVKADGTIERLGLDLDVKSEAGAVRGQIVADFKAPDLRFTGPLYAERLNIGPILKNAKQKSDITGNARIDLAIRSDPAGASALDRLDGTFTFSGPRVAALGYQATQVDVSGSLKGPRITLASARARAYGGAATTRGAIVLPEGKRALSFDLEGSAEHVDMRRLPASIRAPRLASDLSVSEYHVRGTANAVGGSATLRTSEIEGATIGEGTVVEFETGRRPIAYAARGAVSGMNLQRLGKALKISALDDPRYDGTVSGAFDVKGAGTSLKDLALGASGTLADSRVMGTHLRDLTFNTRIEAAALTVYAKGAFDHLNPAVLSEKKALDGNVNGRVDATFRIADLTAPVTPSAITAEGQISLDPSLVGGVQIAAAEVDGRYEAEVADLKKLQVKGPDVTVDASGRLALDRSTASNLKYHIDARDISEVGAIAGQKGLDGSIVLDGTATGNAASLETSGTLAGSALAWNENKTLELRSRYAATIPDLDFANARVQASTDATFVQIGGTQLNQVTATTTYLKKQLEFTTKIQEKTRELDATGQVIFHPDHQEIHLPQLAVRTEGIEWRSVAGGDPAIQYGKDRITLKDIRLASGEQTLDVSGTLSLEAEQPSGALQVRARNVDLAQIERLLLQNRGLGGRLTADAMISGSLQQPMVDGHVEVREGAFQNYKYESLVADVDYTGRKITLDATLQQAPGVSITAKGIVPTSLFERGKGEHIAPTAEDAIDLRIQAPSLNLGIIQGFTTAVTDVSGTMQADVRVTGSGHDPHLEGFVEIGGGAFAVPAGGTSYSGLDTRIDLEPDSVRIRRFEILDENGEQMAISGQLAVHERQVGSVDIAIESQNFEVIDNELGDVGIGTRLKVTGQLLRPRLEGDIRIAAGRLEVDRILQLFYDPYRVDTLPEVVSAERIVRDAGSAREATRQALAQAGEGVDVPAAKAEEEAAEADAARQAGAFENVALDVRLEIPDNLVVRGRRLRPGGPTRAAVGDVNITVGGDLNIRKQPGGPVTVAGTVNTVRGTYQFQGRQFDIARGGTLRFTGESEINPVVDITATRQIPDTGVEARVRVTGSVSAPELQLSSIPPLEESDILSLIVFNRPINDLGTGERASLAATAGGIATGFIATPLGESIGRALDLDLFEITTSTDGDAIGAGITVGEQIGDRTFLKLRQQFGDRPYSEFLLEYQIADFLRLAGSAAPEASGTANRLGQRRIERAGIDLIFFFSY
jgi:autotransporter translocation and assembly factor TamB